MVENNFFKLGSDIPGFHFCALDFLLHIFFFVGEVFVKLAISLHIGLLFKKAEGFFDALSQGRQFLVESIQHQDAQVPNGGFELLDVFDQEERFQQPNREGAVQMVFRLNDGSLDVGFQGSPNALEHQIEGRQLSDLMIPDLDGHLLENTQHGAFTH